MKKLIFGLIATVMMSTVSFGQMTLNENNIGEYHNLQMENYFNLLQIIAKEKGVKNLTKEDVYSTFSEITLKVFGKDNVELRNSTNDNFKNYLSLKIDENIAASVEKIKNSPNTNQKLKDFLVNIISDDINEDNYQKYFETKLEEAKLNFSGEDLKIVQIGINTGISSFTYWSKNFDKWNTIFGSSNSSTMSKSGVGKADVAGAMMGALYGAYGGTAFLPGVGTVSGALAVGCAGGIYASTAASIAYMVDFLF